MISRVFTVALFRAAHQLSGLECTRYHSVCQFLKTGVVGKLSEKEMLIGWAHVMRATEDADSSRRKSFVKEGKQAPGALVTTIVLSYEYFFSALVAALRGLKCNFFSSKNSSACS